jgi:CheY-like chemotaxis protein
MTESPDTPGGRGTILVVERDPHVRVLETLFLTEAGYAVAFADDGTSALEQARRLRPDLLITEIMVPRLDGLALCRLLKEDPDTKGIMVLIFSILTASARARDAGADAFLRKPLAEHKLVDTVEQLMARREDSSRGEGA